MTGSAPACQVTQRVYKHPALQGPECPCGRGSAEPAGDAALPSCTTALPQCQLSNEGDEPQPGPGDPHLAKSGERETTCWNSARLMVPSLSMSDSSRICGEGEQ